MEGSRLQTLVERSEVLKGTFRGVFPKDELVSTFGSKIPWGSYILNSEASGSAGEHWLGLYKQRENQNLLIFFDSFGKAPSQYDMTFPGHQILHNDVTVQMKGTSTCGFFVLFFLYWKSLQFSLIDIVNAFDPDNTTRNEDLVLDFAEELLLGKLH